VIFLEMPSGTIGVLGRREHGGEAPKLLGNMGMRETEDAGDNLSEGASRKKPPP
jgi:hypothetical protein